MNLVLSVASTMGADANAPAGAAGGGGVGLCMGGLSKQGKFKNSPALTRAIPKMPTSQPISFTMFCHFLEPVQHEISLNALHPVRFVMAQYGPGPHH
jgi:hypothetical protein